MKISKVLFTIGMALAVILGLLDGLSIFRLAGMAESIAILAMIGIGVAIGFMNIDTKERSLFLLATLSLGLVAVVVGWVGVVKDFLAPVFINFSYVMLSAGSVVGVKAAIDTSKK